MNSSLRLQIVLWFVILFCVLILGRVFFLSIKSNAYFEELSKQNYIKRVYEPSIRGIIKDRNGVPLAINELGFSIYLEPHLFIDKKNAKFDEIAKIITDSFPEVDEQKIRKTYENEDSHYNHDFIKVVDYINYDAFIAKYAIFNHIPEVQIKTAYKRIYPFKDVGGHIIGYVGKTTKDDIKVDDIAKHAGMIGKSGLEKFYNNTLQGTLGYSDIKVNAFNEEIGVLETKMPSYDNDLQISIDIKLQEFVHNLFKDKSGAVVVMNAKTGEILSAGSFPEIDNNLFANGISKEDWDKIINDFNHPFTNKLVNGLYPPGSVVKMGVGLSFLENGIPEDFSVVCEGEIKIGNRKFRCHKADGHGHTGFVDAIKESCDVFFYTGSLKIGVDKIAATLDKFGLGKASGIDLPNEFLGVNPTQSWKQEKYKKPWFLGETVVSAIGQGYFLTTPVQVARYTGAISTKNLVTPHFKMDSTFVKNTKNIPIVDTHLGVIKEGMYQVCNTPGGTAFKSSTSSVKIGGKTGTAQVIGISQEEKRRMSEHALDYYHRSHAWFTSVGPLENPQFVVTVLIEHGGHGGSVSAPIAAKIFDKLDELGYIK